MELIDIKKKALERIKNSSDLKELNGVYKEYLGKKGELAKVFRSLKGSSDKKKIGREANEVKKILEEKIESKKNILLSRRKKEKGGLDISIPGRKPATGRLHPLTLVKRKIEELFQGMGFSVIEGPEAETEFYNFDALNIPKDHPARDAWDTFYLENGKVLRTHTSPVQIRYMEKNSPPFRIVVPGRIYRHEATDASHDFQFYQVEGLMVGKDVSAANFRAVIKEFLGRFFEKEVKVRLRPSFFPFTEPSFEVDINCLVCGGKGCSVCSQTGWVELLGAGMVHPNVLSASGINPESWQGFAFGIGMDRLAMMKYRIDDVRLFRSSDLRFIGQF